MKKNIILITSILTLCLAIVSLVSGCSPSDTSKLKVVTSTSLIAQIVERVGSDKVDVINIIQPAQCPAHFDVKPGDIQKLADADLFLLHGWQGEKFSQSLVDSVNNTRLIVSMINIPGNWMTPSVQLQAVDEITKILSKADEKNSSAYQKSAADLKEKITVKETEIKGKLAKANLSGINLLCSEQQAGFLQWIGLKVIATYGEADSLTPQVAKDLVDRGKEAGITLIVDNLQNGADVGKGIAEELGAKRITLSNFPGGFENTETWEKAIDRNIDLIMEALAR